MPIWKIDTFSDRTVFARTTPAYQMPSFERLAPPHHTNRTGAGTAGHGLPIVGLAGALTEYSGRGLALFHKAKSVELVVADSLVMAF
jgi:hypothetical protein